MKNLISSPVMVVSVMASWNISAICGIVSLSALMLLNIQTMAFGSVIQNGDFENQPNFGNGIINVGGASAFTGTQIPGWIIENGHAVTIHQTPNHSYISGNYSLNLDGEGYNGMNGNLYQDFASTASTNYTIEYDYKGWLSNVATLTVSVTDVLTSSVVFARTSPWTSSLVHETGTFQGTGNTLRLRISQTTTGTNDNSLIFDNLTVTGAPAVPEPSTMAIFGLGILGATHRSRRKNKA